MLFLIIIQINGVNQIDKFLDSSSGEGTCDDDMSCAGVMKEKFRLFGGNIVAVSLCDNAYNGLCKTHGKHLRKAADVVSAIVTEANDIRVISGRYRRSTAEKRGVGIFAGGVDRVGPGLDGLGLMI